MGSNLSQQNLKRSSHRLNLSRKPRDDSSNTAASASSSLQAPHGSTGRRQEDSVNTSTIAAQAEERVSPGRRGNAARPLALPDIDGAEAGYGQYRTGRTLGSGTYAIVKEAVHIKTGKYYACKVINKKLMEGREFMVRNEIAVLKRISSGHPNIVTLHDYFETANNLYLCFDLCTGGELFDRICAKGNYHEPDAAGLVCTIMKAVQYIHDCGIVHRGKSHSLVRLYVSDCCVDLKPENLLFRTPAEEADIMIADFGLSRVMDEERFQLLTEICGTPGVCPMRDPTGHGKPVDVWAMGVITYFLLAGYTPFDRDSQQQEMEAIIAGDYKFEPAEYWDNVSDTAKDFVSECLTINPTSRPTAAQMLEHRWLADERPHFVPDPLSPTGGPTDLLPHIQKRMDARSKFRKVVLGITAMKRMSLLAHSSPVARELEANILKYKEESEKENMNEDLEVYHHHDNRDSQSELANGDRRELEVGAGSHIKHETAEKLKKTDDISIDNTDNPPLAKSIENLSVKDTSPPPKK
ncbi:hypothetical protein EW146_g5894 [Bondarzewia mesenterica]|uniref:Protein kinase domain-containing protein n=1 Tax=Bondarzewia mesenterica TaxID=1095465 RepID=A0A4V3XEP6_9AGAM|nr:hypothetical protein EW146_g5894 [Bondarzewia mesenterica]